jgi:hypothetical protein
METVQTPNPPTFETVWAALQETRQIITENAKKDVERHERAMKEIAERREEFEREKKEFNKRLGEYINLFGEVTEYEIAPKLRDKFLEFGLDFPKATRIVSIRDKTNDIFLEVDVMLENGDKAVLVEIKTELTVERIKKHINRLEKMRKYADIRGDKRSFLGAVAGVVVTDKERDYALDQGFYLIEPEGLDLNITPPSDKPKEW